MYYASQLTLPFYIISSQEHFQLKRKQIDAYISNNPSTHICVNFIKLNNTGFFNETSILSEHYFYQSYVLS